MLKRIAANILRVSILLVIFLGSCTGSGILYMQSPKWALEKFDLEKAKTFFIAYVPKESDEVEVIFYRDNPVTNTSSGTQFHLPRQKMSYSWDGDGSASIIVKNEENGNQLVQIFVTGDTPWTSLSEYRVINNKIHPLRHGMSNHWFLLGVLISPFLTAYLRKPVALAVNRLVGIKPANTD